MTRKSFPASKGTYGPATDALSIDNCLKCPPHHYCPRPGLSSPYFCGPMAQQPLPGQDTCICPGEGQSFQISNGWCQCTIGYQPANNGDVCVHKRYEVCRDGQTRTQHGDCLDKHQWSLHCRQVCQSAEDYQGYDRELGLCVCREPPGRAACGSLCRNRSAAELQLQCQARGDMELVWSFDSKVSGVSGSLLETAFKQWDSQGNLECNSHHKVSHPVYIVLTTDKGFLGLLSGLPKELQKLFPVTTWRESHSSAEEDSGFLLEFTLVENISHVGMEINSSRMRGNKNDIKKESRSVTRILNPTACLHLGDVLLFTVDTRHYPQYDLDSLYNTNSDFDWGAFRQLKEEMTLSWTPPSFFSMVFNQPGVHVFTLSSNQHKRLYVRVMPAGAQCYEPGPFFPTIPRHVTRVGIRRRSNLLLRPDWMVTGGLLFGAVVILCLCVTALILFREYGWPEKKPIRARYRLLQLAYRMDDYSSKGSRVISLRKTHRSQQIRMTQDSIQAVCGDPLEEFWDYEHQVDLEAFSSNTFYSLLLKQSLSVTTQLGHLTSEVKDLYQGVLGKLQPLHPRLLTQETMGEGCERIQREVEREVVRRKTLASKLRTLLESQLQVLREEQRAQQRVHGVFTAHLRECNRLLSRIYNTNQSFCEAHQQNVLQRITSLVDEMGELLSGACQRQGAWELLGEGTGAKLLCPDSGTVLTKEHIFGPDGSLRVCRALHCDPVTGLIKPNAHAHMLLSSCHTTAVPTDFFLHPQTGRVMPIAGNVAYDPASSTLVFTTSSCTGDNRKWDSPLLPFISYPTSGHSDQPLSSARLRGLKPGQRLQLGAPMADPDTGVPVPILAVTIHPETGLVYPLGGVHVCPVTRLPQPIQIGYPMLDPRTGNIVLTVGVSLDPVTGAVLPVGGVLLAESFIDPLSGCMVRVRGASMRAGQLVPNTGGYQALLDSKVLATMFKILDLLKPLNEEWGSDSALQPHPSSERGSGQHDHLLAATKELQQAWGRSLHCQLQLQTKLEILLDWAVELQQHGGTLGEMPLSDSDVCVPALLGVEYPDPMGSGLSVPVLGCQTDIVSGITVPLAGTMEDPNGKGLVAIRYGSQTVDPVTGVLAPVVGARLDVTRKNILPVSASYWLTVVDQTDSVQVQWSGRQLREASVELHDSSQSEAQRRAAQHWHLALILPQHVFHILTQGDEEEWAQENVWHSELLSGLDKVDVWMEQLQQDQENWTTHGGDWDTTLHAVDREVRQRELWEQCCSIQSELEAALIALHFVRHLSQLRADTAQAVLCGNFWYKDYGLIKCCGQRQTKVSGLLQHKALPLLERLNQLLDEKHCASFSTNTSNRHISGLSTKQAYGLEIASRVWTASVPVVKGISTQSLREPVNLAQSLDNGLQASSAQTRNSQRQTASSGIHSQESQPTKNSAQPSHISVPAVPEEEWTKLLGLSPLFQLLKKVDQQLQGSACGAGILRGGINDRDNSFVDILDAQWECEGELIPLDPSVLNPREFLVYHHGLFLMQTLCNLKLTPAISIQIAASLPKNNYLNNAFKNSFFYQEAEEMLFVRRQRLQSVGGFSLLLLHCLSHVKMRDMSSDSSPAFQRLFFKVLQACLGELFHSRIGMCSTGQEANLRVCFQDPEAPSGDKHGGVSDVHAASVPYKLHKSSRGVLSEGEVEELQSQHSEISLLSHLEGLLREKSSEATENNQDHIA
ncbi:hypothetical protein JOB18_021861 [Solea senegalensis]|uniref:Uncharacterized protein n=1 Tax=Solea senegalensis TaxID=28829 RepID=A0AAV6PW92_SOLSE|nr:hypothetical protein JOB18_021861 [Solea senegalensis]